MHDSLKEVWEYLLVNRVTDSKEPLELNISAKCVNEMRDALNKYFKKRESRAKKKCPNCNRKPYVWYCMNRTMIKCPRCGLAAKQFKTEIDAIRDWNKMVDLMSSNSQ